MMGISTTFFIVSTVWLRMGAFTTTPKAPCASASLASITLRMPSVTPPPTPHTTGMEEAEMMASIMTCCGVKG